MAFHIALTTFTASFQAVAHVRASGEMDPKQLLLFGQTLENMFDCYKCWSQEERQKSEQSPVDNAVEKDEKKKKRKYRKRAEKSMEVATQKSSDPHTLGVESVVIQPTVKVQNTEPEPLKKKRKKEKTVDGPQAKGDVEEMLWDHRGECQQTPMETQPGSSTEGTCVVKEMPWNPPATVQEYHNVDGEKAIPKKRVRKSKQKPCPPAVDVPQPTPQPTPPPHPPPTGPVWGDEMQEELLLAAATAYPATDADMNAIDELLLRMNEKKINE